MIERIVSFVLRLRAIVYMSTVLLIFGGAIAYIRLDVEAYPNPVPPLVETIVQPAGWSAEEVERYITIPLEVGLAGMPGLAHMRSQSLFELSDIKCYFSWDTQYKDARQEVINRLTLVQLPNNNTATLSPWNAIGEIYRYTLEGDYSLLDKKTVEDWTLERQFKRVPGVIDVTSYGGLSKQYHAEVDPFRLRGHNVTLTQLTSALANANQNVGGRRLSMGEQSYDVRGIGLVGSRGMPLHDINDVVIALPHASANAATGADQSSASTDQHAAPVRVRDIAEVTVGYAPRLGKVGHDDDDDVVQGIVLMRYGGETPSTLEGVHDKLKYIEDNNVLPPGMKIVPYYDRGKFVGLTMNTVLENLLIGMGLVVVTLLLFLGNTRAALITALNIPLALLCAFIGLVATSTSANLISLGAIDFGIVVDSTVIMMENIFRHLGPHGKGRMDARLLTAAHEVGTPMTFSTLIIAVAFLPLFTLTGVPGAIFAPMARTYAFAIGGAILLALTLTPALAVRVMKSEAEEKEVFLMRWLHKAYAPLFDAALKRPRFAMVIRAVPVFACVALFPLLGRDFMPKLEEGNLWIRATLPMSISLEKSSEYATKMRRILRGCPSDPAAFCNDGNRTHPEVITVISQLGRPDDGTDVTGYFNIEFFAPLKPFDEWRPRRTKKELTDTLNSELSEAFPGVVFNFSQYISDNVEEAVAGVKGENSVKVFGPDLEENESTADRIVDVLNSVPGITDLGMLKSLGQPNIKITPDRKKLARYGLNTGDVDAVVQSAVGGNAVTQVYEGEKMFDLTVRWMPKYRSSLEAIREITISTPDGAYIPLGQVATIEQVDGPTSVYRQDGQRYTPIKFSVRNRDLAGAIDEAQRKVKTEVHLPYTQHIEWEGEIKELHDVERRLLIIIPLTILLIGFLTYTAVKNWLDTLIVLVDIPVACSGGVLALLITGINFSVSAAMGFVSIFGIAIQDAILVVTYFQRLRVIERHSIEQAAREAAEKRFRPVLMTTLVATFGLLPAAISNGIGAQTQKPLAIVVIGGSLILAVLTRVMQPPLLVLAHRWREQRMRPPPDIDTSPESSLP